MKNLLYLLLLLAGFPVGLLLAYICKEEVKAWKKRLSILSGISLLLIVVVSFLSFEYKLPVIISLFFITIVCWTIIWKGS
jgi:predicted Na+-dependent transporter